MPYASYPYNNPLGDDYSGSPADIGKPINIDPLGGINDRPKFKSRKDRERTAQDIAERGRDAMSTKPLGHWTQALAQVLEGGVAGYDEAQLAKDDEQRRSYLAAALEGDQSAEDLMRGGIENDVPELTEFGQYKERRADRQADVDWRHQQYETEQGWKQKSYDLANEELDWKKTKGPEGSTPKVTDVTTMRKEIQDMDSARAYSAAIPAYNTMLKAGPGKPGDLTMVYSLAKLYDPGGVVMEGDKKSIAANASLPESVWGYLSALGGGSEFGPELRAKIVAEATAKAQSLKSAYEKNLEPYRYIAKHYGIDEKLIIPQFEEYGGYKIVGTE